MPLKANERHCCKVWFSSGDERVMKRICLSAGCWSCSALAVLQFDTVERVLRGHDRRIETMNDLPCASHAKHAEICLSQTTLHTRALLQSIVELIDAARRYCGERRKA